MGTSTKDFFHCNAARTMHIARRGSDTDLGSEGRGPILFGTASVAASENGLMASS
jgi:hypothetical protein